MFPNILKSLEGIRYHLAASIPVRRPFVQTTLGVDISYISPGPSTAETVTLLTNVRTSTLAQVMWFSLSVQFELATVFSLIDKAIISFTSTPGNPIVRGTSLSATPFGSNTLQYHAPEFTFSPASPYMDVSKLNLWLNATMNPTLNLTVYGNFTAAIALNGYFAMGLNEYPSF